MTLATNYDHVGLDQSDQDVLEAYARQINKLEDTSGATPAYDAGLERVFNQIKALMQNDHAAGSSHTGGSPPEGSPSGTGSSSNSNSQDDTTPHSGDSTGAAPIGLPDLGPAPAERASIDQIASTAGPDTATAVKQIADGAAAAVGGDAGSALADRVAQAGAQAAQHVIDTGGTPADAQAAATTAARAVATAGAAAGPDAANQVFQIGAVVDPATAAQISNVASQAAQTIGGSIGAAVATAVTRAGLSAATVASVSGLSSAAIASASLAAAQAASSAASAVIAAGGTTSSAAAAADAVASAAGFGGVSAATSVSQAAVTFSSSAGGNVGAAIARTIALATQNAFTFAGGTAAGVTAISAAASTAELALQTAQTVTALGLPAAIAGSAAGLIANAARLGGFALASEISPLINFVSLGHGTSAQMTTLATAVEQAYRAEGIDAARAVTSTSTQMFQNMVTPGSGMGAAPPFGGINVQQIVDVTNIVAIDVSQSGASIANDVLSAVNAVRSRGGDLAAMKDAGNDVSQAFAMGGQTAADSVANAIQTVAARDGSVENMDSASTAIIRSFHGFGGEEGAASIIQAINATPPGTPDLLNNVMTITGDMAAAGDADAASIASARSDITRIFNTHGGQAAHDVSILIDQAYFNDVGPMQEFTRTVLQAGIRGGLPLATDASQVARLVAANGGDGGAIDVVSSAITNAFRGGEQPAADALVRAARSVAHAGGTGDQIALASETIGEQIYLTELQSDPDNAVRYARRTAQSFSQAVQRGANANDLIRSISQVMR